MKLTLHHLDNGTFAAEIPTESGEKEIVFSSSYDTNAERVDHYSVLSRILRASWGIILPPISETGLTEPGEETVSVKVAS